MMTRILPGTTVEVMAGEREPKPVTVGVVAMPLQLSWGDVITVIEKSDRTLMPLGYERNDLKLKLVNEVLRSAQRLIVYRLNPNSTKSQALLAEGITVSAKYGGQRGNDLKVTVTANEAGWQIKTYLGTAEVDAQTVTGVADFEENGFITLSGSGDLAAASVTLAGGGDGDIESGAYAAFMTELEKQQYNLIAYTGTDNTVAQNLVDFVDHQRLNDVNVQLVQSLISADNKAIYKNVVGGVTVGYTLTAAEACATLAGILAKQGITGSATYFDVAWWEDVSPRLTKVQQEAKTKAGDTLFVYMHGAVKLLYDINSLTTFTAENPKDFCKGLVVRTLDQMASEIKLLLDSKAIGKIRNSTDGRARIKGMLVTMLKAQYLDKGYLEAFNADDLSVEQGGDRDAIAVTVGVKVADTVDKIYVTVTTL